MKFDLDSPLAVVCNDAGATNLMLPWLKKWPGELRPYMTGPAAKLWDAAFPGRTLMGNLSDALSDAQVLLSGTGWASTTEHEARVAAAARGMRSIAVLDHWVNYAPRFVFNDRCQLPDELWVTDGEAELIARQAFPGLPVVLQPNLYVAEQLEKIGPRPDQGYVLYVLEPVRNEWGMGRPGEYQALDFAIEHLPRITAGFSAPVLILRPHPSEPVGKYQSYVDRYAFIRMDSSSDVATAINNADIVLGVESFALTIALQAGRPVFSTLPPWAPNIRLPHQRIVQIRNLP